ncbi:histidine phosphatase family protein [Streptococcus tangpeifui]|uniref:histidine phosphatase family protein n=1 Tax=Streptococcus tangpeifui TaxID=2709400 RepID=UPI0013E9EAEE|nr:MULTISPECIES: histidine phosphatase family protein [unclassified Streptococcus]
MRLYFVRHGKTQWNLEGRFQGSRGDSPLLEQSIQDLRELGRYLSTIHFDKFYSSDLRRARETARIINNENQKPTEIIPSQALREWNLGRLEGQKISTIAAIYPKQMAAFRHNLAKFDNTFFEAESVYQATRRVASFIAKLDYQHDRNVLLVGHGACFTAAINYLLGFESGQLREHGGLDNGSVTILDSDDGKRFNLIRWNDTSYLNGQQKLS